MATTKSKTNNSPADVSSLLLSTLPEEVYLLILDHLPIPSILALSQTSKSFNRIVNPTCDPKRRLLLDEFLVEAQNFPRWRGDGFACFVCVGIFPRRRFVDELTKDEYGRGGGRQKGRFCVLCGLKTGRLEKGRKVWRGTSLLVVCWRCGLLNEGWQGGVCKVCRDCAVCDQYGGLGEVGEREGIAC